MNLHHLLSERAEAGRPVRVGLIGCGKFGTMFAAQARLTPGLHVLGIADLKPDHVRGSLKGAGWADEQLAAADLAQALADGSTHLGDDADALIAASGLDVLVEATGDPRAGLRHALAAIEQGRHLVMVNVEADVLVEATGDPRAGLRHALAAIEHGRHLVMVNVEADVLVGPVLAERAHKAGLVYSLAYGDQPALICEMVDWARACGFPVVCAGKGTRYMPHFHQSTPGTVWTHFGITTEEAQAAGMNPKMFNSFVDGTKSSIEMAAVANATGLLPQSRGLSFPPCSVDDLPYVLRPAAMGGHLEHEGTVEVISDRERDGRPVHHDLRMGVYVTFRAPTDYAKACLAQYNVALDPSGTIAALHRPIHMIGLELGISVASAALRGEPTGFPKAFRADVVATAKRDLEVGEVLDGEGGETVWGSLLPIDASIAEQGLPLGLAHGVRVTRRIAAGSRLSLADVDLDRNDEALRLRQSMLPA